jgi:hypothetical protein
MDLFVRMSELLTGFGRVDLLGTGLAECYLQTMDAILPPGVPDEVLAAFAWLPADPDREAAAGAMILDDPKLGPVARNIILMWYRGTWTALPQAWRLTHGASPLDVDHVISAEAYQAGLQWIAAGAHPVGARQQGYGAWAADPARDTPVNEPPARHLSKQGAGL